MLSLALFAGPIGGENPLQGALAQKAHYSALQLVEYALTQLSLVRRKSRIR